jgi:hypothetical protein
MANIVLTDTQYRGLIAGAIQREHAAASSVFKAQSGGSFRARTASDKPTPAVARYKQLEATWAPVLQQINAMPVVQALKGVLPDPRATPVPAPKGGA